ncbi:hypothetical protein [Bosea sp. (in: a-proteobacteria)]|uniref:DUF6931 family protein n=1 Tax=Bosea sp. (in: a-proteobacteria) TaxID=1871050 RepID=UPI0027345C62|nr:hypothetical protein [Bosea sp. (in: a-proteobacteria)]MDP3410995.1 hypothetical protein [Bosea sp. (in: a-proteobacteria)]
MSRLRFSTAREVFETFPALGKVVATRPSVEHPLAFARALALGPAPAEAIGFCAFVLPRREAVWWAAQALRAMQAPGALQDQGLAAAEAWVRDPRDETRRAALAAADAGDSASPGTWVAFAAGYSGGSMVAGHAVPCPPDLTAKMARIAVLTALGRLTGREHQAALRNCVEACIRLADDDGKPTS